MGTSHLQPLRHEWATDGTVSPLGRQLVVVTVCRALDCTDGTLPILVIVLVERYWREVSTCAYPNMPSW
ncbi:hypothetical protein [Streptomyces sp. bgisy031]|uniref:hypothetical protein n=1 Tax=Streptomyces sp. bgisy031 TaxID=3413772 RepID=UPI003D75BBBF